MIRAILNPKAYAEEINYNLNYTLFILYFTMISEKC